jgi:Tol biopolymer transport system component
MVGMWMVLGLALSVRGGAGADAPVAGAERLAFVAETAGSQEVHVVDVSRSTMTRVARGLADVESLTWSPDGARLAFSARSGGPSSVFVVQSDGTQLRSLATGRSPSWSPDGTRIAYSAPQDGDEEIFVAGLDGSDPKRLTTHPGRDTTPRWTPDGRQIAFASGRSDSSRLQGVEYGSEIHLMNADGSDARALTAHNACGLANESEGKLNRLGQADWAPDGRRLLYRAGVCKFDCRVCVIDLATGGVSPLVNERMVSTFALSPDGRSVAYSWNRQIIVMDLETGARRPLVQDAWGPAWSRDGGRIAFLIAASPDVNARLYHIETIEPDGRNRRRVSQRSGNYWSLTWSPVPARP